MQTESGEGDQVDRDATEMQGQSDGHAEDDEAVEVAYHVPAEAHRDVVAADGKGWPGCGLAWSLIT